MIQIEKLHILFVEDNIFQARLTISIIETHLGMRLTHVTTLAETIAKLKTESYDLILLDLNLPDSSGLQTLIAIQQTAPASAVVIITAREDENLAQEAVEHGAQDFIHKSNLDPELLRRSIRYAILRHQTQMELHVLKQRQEDAIRHTLHEIEELDSAQREELNVTSKEESLRKRNPESFNRLLNLYMYLIDNFMKRISEGKSILGITQSLCTKLFEVNANPNDVNDLHLSSLKKYLADKTPEEEKAILVDGRMFALEVMGNLAEVYRAEYLKKGRR